MIFNKFYVPSTLPTSSNFILNQNYRNLLSKGKARLESLDNVSPVAQEIQELRFQGSLTSKLKMSPLINHIFFKC